MQSALAGRRADMSHHSSQPNEAQRAMSEAMRELMGEYPQGRLNANDAGAVAMAVRTEAGKVIIDFPKPIAWIGFTGDDAMALASLLVKHARVAGLTKPATLVI